MEDPVQSAGCAYISVESCYNGRLADAFEISPGVDEDVVVAKGVVRNSGFELELEVARPSAERKLVLIINGRVAGAAAIEAAGRARVVFPMDSTLLLDSLEVKVLRDGKLASVNVSDSYLLNRLIVRDNDDFRRNVMRKHIRVRDPETLIAAGQQALLRFQGDLLQSAVANCAIGYRFVDNIDAASPEEIAQLRERVERLLAKINPEVAEEARWATTLEVLMYQVYAVGRNIPEALQFLYRLFRHRHLLKVEPICTFNIMIGVLILGYLYRESGRGEDAEKIWGEWEWIFVQSAILTPKRFGTIYEFERIRLMCQRCVEGTMEIHGKTDQRAKPLTDDLITEVCLRVTGNKAKKRLTAFIRDIRVQGPVLVDMEELFAE